MVWRLSEWNLNEKIVLFVKETDLEVFEARKCEKLILREQKLYYDDMCQEIELTPMEGEWGTFCSGDILSIYPDGRIRVIKENNTQEVDIFVTNKCNSNCIMCPLAEVSRRNERKQHINWLMSYINILPDNVGYINITGGEPTLAKEDFLIILKMLRDKFQHSDFQLLTNGRSAADESFLERILEVCPKGIRFAIPVHSTKIKTHDMITQVSGSFRQTDIGIKNLLKHQQKVEVRIVLSKMNVYDVEETAVYIVKNYKGVFCVNFVAMEMMGNAVINKELLWIDYEEIFRKCKPAIDILVNSGIDVQLYNFPLCAVNRGYWHIAARSISEYKIRFMDECEKCEVKEICGGFFYSTKQVMRPAVKPIGKTYGNKLF